MTEVVVDRPAEPGPEAAPEAGPAIPSPLAATKKARDRRARRRLVVVFGVLAAAVVYLLVVGLGSSLDYFDTVDQALAHKHHLGTTTFRLEGLVDRHTIHATTTGTDFTLSEGRHHIEVHNSGSPPALFQAAIPVVAIGHFASKTSYLFLSNGIEVKHSATYIAAHPTRVRAPNGSIR